MFASKEEEAVGCIAECREREGERVGTNSKSGWKDLGGVCVGCVFELVCEWVVRVLNYLHGLEARRRSRETRVLH
jgi:hypothetical protein